MACKTIHTRIGNAMRTMRVLPKTVWRFFQSQWLRAIEFATKIMSPTTGKYRINHQCNDLMARAFRAFYAPNAFYFHPSLRRPLAETSTSKKFYERVQSVALQVPRFALIKVIHPSKSANTNSETP